LRSSRMSHIARRTRFQSQRNTNSQSSTTLTTLGKAKSLNLNLFTPSSRVEPLSTSLHEDLGLLLKRIRLYRNELISPLEIEEFECKSLASILLLFHL
jgi:hypothetical protein